MFETRSLYGDLFWEYRGMTDDDAAD